MRWLIGQTDSDGAEGCEGNDTSASFERCGKQLDGRCTQCRGRPPGVILKVTVRSTFSVRSTAG